MLTMLFEVPVADAKRSLEVLTAVGLEHVHLDARAEVQDGKAVIGGTVGYYTEGRTVDVALDTYRFHKIMMEDVLTSVGIDARVVDHRVLLGQALRFGIT